MRILQFALFLPTLSLSFFENAGLAFEEKRPLELFNPPTEVHFYRTFATKSTREIRARIQACITQENQLEEDLEAQASYKIRANQILQEIHQLWRTAITDLTSTAGSRDKRSIWSTTKQVTRFIYKSPFLRSVLTLANSYMGNIVSIFTDQDHYEQLEHLEHKIINNTHLIKQSNNVVLARLMDLEHQHCLQYNELYLFQEVTHMIRTIEEEILETALGKIPPHASYVSGLISSCSKLGNSPRFCHKLLQNNLIKIQFGGLSFDEETQILISKTVLSIPIEKESPSNLRHIKVINLGNWEREGFFKLNLKGDFIIQGDQILALDQDQCADTLCPFSAIRTEVPECFSSLLKNSTVGCVKIFQEPPAYCEIENYGSDYILAIPRGDVIFNELQPMKSMTVINQTILVDQKVTLQCHGVTGLKTVTIKDEILYF